MDILSKMPERLKELMFDKGINAPTLAKAINVKSNTVTRYIQGVRLPKFETFIVLVDYFHCSADFLLGLTDNPQYEENYLPTPFFRDSFRVALGENQTTQYALQKKTNISWANFHYWLNGIRLPYLDSLVKLACAMDCSVDCLLGRVK
jgi:transcriptional regulator with XRE-family HTH domain